MDDKVVERVARAICHVLHKSDSTRWPHYKDASKAAIIAITTPPAGTVKLPSVYSGKSKLNGHFSTGELRAIADWIDRSGFRPSA